MSARSFQRSRKAYCSRSWKSNRPSSRLVSVKFSANSRAIFKTVPMCERTQAQSSSSGSISPVALIEARNAASAKNFSRGSNHNAFLPWGYCLPATRASSKRARSGSNAADCSSFNSGALLAAISFVQVSSQMVGSHSSHQSSTAFSRHSCHSAGLCSAKIASCFSIQPAGLGNVCV